MTIPINLRAEAIVVELAALLERLRGAERQTRADAESRVAPVSDTFADAYARGLADGTATGLGIAARWAAALIDRVNVTCGRSEGS